MFCFCFIETRKNIAARFAVCLRYIVRFFFIARNIYNTGNAVILVDDNRLAFVFEFRPGVIYFFFAELGCRNLPDIVRQKNSFRPQVIDASPARRVRRQN